MASEGQVGQKGNEMYIKIPKVFSYEPLLLRWVMWPMGLFCFNLKNMGDIRLINCFSCFIYADCGLYIVGSSMSGFGTLKSDMDMCLMLTPDSVSVDIKSSILCILTKNEIFQIFFCVYV
jgi:hypothetical protein